MGERKSPLKRLRSSGLLLVGKGLVCLLHQHHVQFDRAVHPQRQLQLDV